MARWLLTALLLTGPSAAAGAQDPPPAPRGPHPTNQLASAEERAGGVVVRFTRLVTRYREVKVRQDGQEVTRYVPETSWVGVDVPADGKEVMALGVDGKPIDPKDLPRRLARRTLVVVFAFGPGEELRPDPMFLGLLRDGVVVIAGRTERLFPEYPKLK
jgi:hypothetical protein